MTAQFEPSEMVDYAEQIAREMVGNMPDEEAIYMVRDFIRVMADWQPEVYRQLEDPCLLYTSPSPRDRQKSRMPSSA